MDIQPTHSTKSTLFFHELGVKHLLWAKMATQAIFTIVNATYPVWTQNPEYIEACRTVPHPGDRTSYHTAHPGVNPTDVTSFKVGLAGWHRDNLPNIMYQLWPCRAWKAHKDSPKPGPKLDAQGNYMFEQHPRVGHAPRLILDFPILRGIDQISTQVPWWFLEMLFRLEPRLEWKDIDVLMDNVGRRLLQPAKDRYVNAWNNTLSRGRQDSYMVSWREKSKGAKANEARDKVLRVLSQRQVNANTTRGTSPGPDLQGNIIPIGHRPRANNLPPAQPAAAIQPPNQPQTFASVQHTAPAHFNAPPQTYVPVQPATSVQSAPRPKRPVAGYKRARPTTVEDTDIEHDDGNDLNSILSSGPVPKRRRIATQSNAFSREELEASASSERRRRPTLESPREIPVSEPQRTRYPLPHGLAYGDRSSLDRQRRSSVVLNQDTDTPRLQGRYALGSSGLNPRQCVHAEAPTRRQKRRMAIEDEDNDEIQNASNLRSHQDEVSHREQKRRRVDAPEFGESMEPYMRQGHPLAPAPNGTRSRRSEFVQQVQDQRSQRMPPRSTSSLVHSLGIGSYTPHMSNLNAASGNTNLGDLSYGNDNGPLYDNSPLANYHYGTPALNGNLSLGVPSYGNSMYGNTSCVNPPYTNSGLERLSYEDSTLGNSWLPNPCAGPPFTSQPQYSGTGEIVGPYDSSSYGPSHANVYNAGLPYLGPLMNGYSSAWHASAPTNMAHGDFGQSPQVYWEPENTVVPQYGTDFSALQSANSLNV